MINLDFSFAVSLYLLIFVAVIFAVWLATQKQKTKDLSLDERFIWFCSVCTHTYINTKEDTISTCPRCGSYNKRELPLKK
jgi:Zn finger protein HypA/HybF involved in hydrogenase expression